MNGEPLIKAGLWAKTTTNGGGRYLGNRLGGVKIPVFVNGDRRSESEPLHLPFFAKPVERRWRAKLERSRAWTRDRRWRCWRRSGRPARASCPADSSAGNSGAWRDGKEPNALVRGVQNGQR
jgi:hypothetical protein